MEKYNFFIDESDENAENVDYKYKDEDKIVIENESKKNKSVFQHHGISLIILFVISSMIIIFGCIAPAITAKNGPLFYLSFLILLVGILIFSFLMVIVWIYYKIPIQISFDGSTGTFSLEYDKPKCFNKLEVHSLDDILDVYINKQVISGNNFHRTDYTIFIELKTKKFNMPILLEEEMVKENIINKIVVTLSKIMTIHKQQQIFIQINDKGVKNIE